MNSPNFPTLWTAFCSAGLDLKERLEKGEKLDVAGGADAATQPAQERQRKPGAGRSTAAIPLWAAR